MKIEIKGNIDEKLTKSVIKQLENVTDSIELEINSLGGSVFEAFRIMNAVKEKNLPITCKYTGWSASAATIIGSIGDRVIANPYVMLLIHEVRQSFPNSMTPSQLDEARRDLENWNNMLYSVYVDKSGRGKEIFEEKMKLNKGEGEWISAREAMEMGLVDEVIYDNSKTIYKEKSLILNEVEMNNLFISDNLKKELKNMELNDVLNTLKLEKSEDIINSFNELGGKIAEFEGLISEKDAKIAELESKITLIEQTEKEKEMENFLQENFELGKITNEIIENLRKIEDFELVKGIVNAIPTPKKEEKTLNSEISNALTLQVSDERSEWTIEDWGKKDPQGLINMFENDYDKYITIYRKSVK